MMDRLLLYWNCNKKGVLWHQCHLDKAHFFKAEYIEICTLPFLVN